jgi:hypothetical protein
VSFPLCNEQYSVALVPLYRIHRSDNDSRFVAVQAVQTQLPPAPPGMVHEAVKNAFSSFYEYSKAFVLGTITRFQKLRWLGKLVIVAFLLFYIALVAVFLVIGPGTIFQVHMVPINDPCSMLRILVFLQSISAAEEDAVWLAHLWNSHRCVLCSLPGPLLKFVIQVVASFPPVVGFYTCISITGQESVSARVSMSNIVIGFAWGLKGFYIAGPGALLGAGLSFLSLRFLFKHRLAQLQQSNKHWKALDQVVVRV